MRQGMKNCTPKLNPAKDFGKVLGIALVRPPRLLATQPIIMSIAAYMAYLSGLVHLVLPTFPGLWKGVYHESGK